MNVQSRIIAVSALGKHPVRIFLDICVSAMNEAVYERVRERVKDYNLSEQEIQAIDKARRQLNTHTSLGGFTGSLVAFLLGKRKKFAPMQVFALAAGGFLIGSQMGLISGSLAGVRAIKELPDPQRLVNLVRDVQKEMIQARGQQGPLPRAPQPQPVPINSDNTGSYTAHGTIDEFSADEASDYSKLSSEFENDRTDGFSNSTARQDSSSSWSKLQTEQRGVNNRDSAWDKIRAQSAPDNAWAKLRMEAQKDPESMDSRRLANARAETARGLQERSKQEAEELPRTREETVHRHTGPVRTNQWGDPIE
ncbi:hypothetical protein BX666DRAFT_1889512 [Dichotomocladium elegans]|nr:hypothetical protein BX666DRAFT_1889512 [Dichotomocladium elegans]